MNSLVDKIDTVVIIEDINQLNTFYPLTLSTPIQNIIIGGLRYFEHIIKYFLLHDKLPEIKLITRNYLAINWPEVLGKYLLNEFDVKIKVEYLSKDKVFLSKNTLVLSTKISPTIENLDLIIKKLNDHKLLSFEKKFLCGVIEDLNEIYKTGKEIENVKLISGIWDIVKVNEEVCKETLEFLINKFRSYFENIDNRLYKYGISEVENPVIIKGKVLLINSQISAFTYISGYCILRNSKTMPNTIIRSYVCTYNDVIIGGEIKNVNFDCYTRKEHFGYLGDSYVGRFVNFGAGTTISNLKNTYGNIKYRGINTGLRKFGATICDWVKTAINTSIYSGHYIGQFSQIYGVVYRDIEPFTIWLKPITNKLYEVRIDKAIEMYKRFSNRYRINHELEINLIKTIFELTINKRLSYAKEEMKLT